MMSAISVTIRVGGQEVAAELDQSATALDLLELLPLEVPLKDFHHQEKLGRLPRPLTTRGAPPTSGAEPADIGYYAPSQHLVIYYSAVGAFPGIVPIGRYAEESIDLVRSLPDGTVASLTRR